MLVLLGASATSAVLGSGLKVTEQRGKPIETDLADVTFVTLHPAALLRIPDATERRAARREYLAEFRRIARYL